MSETKKNDALKVLEGFLLQENKQKMKVDLVPLLGGRSGAGLYTFKVSNKTYVLRMFAAMEELSGRKRESQITAQVAKFGFAPQVYFIDPKYKGMVIEFLPGGTLVPKESKKPENIKRFASFLNELHHLKIEDLTADGYFKRGKEWLLKAKKNEPCFPTGMDKLIKAIDEIESIVMDYPFPKRLIHSDLISRNIMFDGKDFKLVDWPASGYGNPYWDIIDYVDFQSFDKQEILLFLTSYFDRELSQEDWDLFVVLRPIPSIVRVIGGFAFMPDVKRKEFYDRKRENQNLITFHQLINDFAQDRMDVEHWEVTMAFLIEAEEQIASKEFQAAFNNLKGKLYDK